MSGRVWALWEWAASCPSLGPHWGSCGPWMEDTFQGAKVTVATLSARLPRTAGGYIDPIALWGDALLQLTSTLSQQLESCQRAGGEHGQPWRSHGTSQCTVLWGSGELICEVAPTAMLSTPVGLPNRVPGWVLVSLGGPKPRGASRLCRTWRMAKEFVLMTGRCGLQPAVSSQGGSGHFGFLGPVSCCGMMASEFTVRNHSSWTLRWPSTSRASGQL